MNTPRKTIISREKFRSGRRIYCYMDTISIDGRLAYAVYTGRPCDPNTIEKKFSDRYKAIQYTKDLLAHSTDKTRI